MALTNVPGSAGMSELIADFKEVYGQLKDLVPNNFIFTKQIPFSGGTSQMGKEFVEPVVLSLEGGVTYGGEGGSAFNLNDYITHNMQSARIQASEMVLRSAVSMRAVSGTQNDKASFKRGLQLMIANMMKSMYHRLEVALLYGQDSIGVVETVTPVVGDTSRITIKIADAEWAAGIWVGTNKHKIDFLSATLAAKRTATNVVAFVVDSYDLEKREIVIQGLGSDNKPVSNIAAADMVATDKIFFYGEVDAGGTPTHYNIIGLKAIAEKRGLLFSINNSQLPLFQGNVIDCGTSSVAKNLDFSTIERSAARGVEKGVSNEEMTALISVDSWNDLLEDQAAKRRYSGSEVATLKEGARELEFFGQTGAIKIVPSTFVKSGYAFTYCKADLLRIGNYDVTMEPPGFEDEPITRLENANGYQLRAQSDQCLFTSKPGSVSVIRYVTNSRLTPPSP